MPTTNTYIGPADGWVEVASAPKFVRVSAAPYSHPFYVFAKSTAPAATDVGVLVCRHPFEVNEIMTEKLYVRVPVPVPDANQNNGKLRLDVFTIV